MPIFFQQQLSDDTRLAVWKIEESEAFFKGNVPLHREVTHPHKRLQHLAGRFLLQFLFPGFPYELVQIADTRKPFLPAEQYHFSISHCGDFAAAIVSRKSRVGVDIEIPVPKLLRIKDKFLSAGERAAFGVEEEADDRIRRLTVLWSAKEAVFKWYGNGQVDFSEQICLQEWDEAAQRIDCFFSKTGDRLAISYRMLDQLVLAWVES